MSVLRQARTVSGNARANSTNAINNELRYLTMKNLTLLLLAILPSFLFAQHKKDRKLGLTVNLNSIGSYAGDGLGNIHYDNYKTLDGGDAKFRNYSLGGNATHFVSEEIGLRLKVAYTKWDITEYRDTRDIQSSNPLYTRIDNVSFNSSDLSFALGGFYRYKIKKIALTGGLDLDYIVHNKGVYTDIISQADPNPSLSYIIKNTITLPKGNSYGIGGFIGLDFFPVDYLSIGLEFSSALLKTKVGNVVSSNSIVISGHSQPQDDSYHDSIDRFQFNQISSSLNISFWF